MVVARVILGLNQSPEMYMSNIMGYVPKEHVIMQHYGTLLDPFLLKLGTTFISLHSFEIQGDKYTSIIRPLEFKVLSHLY